MVARKLSKTLLVTGAALGGAMALLATRKQRQRTNGISAIDHPMSPPSPRQAEGDSEPPETGRHPVRRAEGPPRAEFHGAAPQDDTVGQVGTYQREMLGLVQDQVTARPHPHLHKPTSGDDFDAFTADQLGVAFLSRATESGSDDLDAEDYAGLTEIDDPDESLMSEASVESARFPDENGTLRDSPFADDGGMDHDAEDAEEDLLDDLPAVSRR